MELDLIDTDSANNEATVRINIENFTPMGAEAKRYIHEFTLKAEVNGTTITRCLDASEMFQRSIARAMCKHLCPDTDPECAAVPFNPASPDYTESAFQKCNRAANEALKQSEKEVCRELGTWDNAAGRCVPLFRDFAGACSAGQILVGARRNIAANEPNAAFYADGNNSNREF